LRALPESAPIAQRRAREAAVVSQALAAARAALERLDAAGVPWRRPADYYAEMVKSDAHMARVKAQLMHEQAQIEAADERCAARAVGAAARDAPRRGTLTRLLHAAACVLLDEPHAAALSRTRPCARVEPVACLGEAACGGRACHRMR